MTTNQAFPGTHDPRPVAEVDAQIKAENAEALARQFHETYERLAPQFGYETRADTKAFDPTTPNGRLMIAVCAALEQIAWSNDSVWQAQCATEARATLSRPVVEQTIPAAQAGQAQGESAEWCNQAKRTLDRLASFLQNINAPHAVNWREWIQNAENMIADERAVPAVDRGLSETARAALSACERIVEQYNGWPQCGIDFYALRNSLNAALAASAPSQGEPRLTEEARVGNGVFGIGVPERLVIEAAKRAAQHPQGGINEEAGRELRQMIADNAGRAAFLESHPAVSKELCDLIEENERLRDAIADQPEGFVLVPVEPTEAMLRAMTDPFIAVNGDNRQAFGHAYSAMLAAVQPPQAPPAAPSQAEPMTDERIDAIVDRHYRSAKHPDSYAALRAAIKDAVCELAKRPFTYKSFDLAAFAAALQRAADARGVTAKEISQATGVSETTLSRMKSGARAPDAASLAALSAWAGLNPANFCAPNQAGSCQASESTTAECERCGLSPKDHTAAHWCDNQSFATPPAGRTLKSLSASVADALRPFLGEGQKVIWREPFRWFDDNGLMSNHYDGMSVSSLAAEFGYEVIHDCECAAVIRAAASTTVGDHG